MNVNNHSYVIQPRLRHEEEELIIWEANTSYLSQYLIEGSPGNFKMLSCCLVT